MFAALLATFLFSISVVSANRSIQLVGGTAANFVRLLFATGFLSLWAYLFGQGLGGGTFFLFFLSGCVGFGLGDLALYQALPRLGSRLTILMVHCLAAPFAAIVEWSWIGTRLSGGQILSALVILAGVALALAPREHLPISRQQRWRGIFFAVVAAFGQSFGAVLSRKAYALGALSGEVIDGGTAAYQRILGGILVALISMLWLKGKANFLTEPGSAKTESVWRDALPWVLLNSLAGPTLGVSCYQWALETTPSGIVLPIVATTPLAVIPFAYALEGDRPSLRSVVGGIIAVIGAVALVLAKS